MPPRWLLKAKTWNKFKRHVTLTNVTRNLHYNAIPYSPTPSKIAGNSYARVRSGAVFKK